MGRTLLGQLKDLSPSKLTIQRIQGWNLDLPEMWSNKFRKVPKLFFAKIPLYLVLLLLLNIGLLTFALTKLATPTYENPEEIAKELAKEVLPSDGYSTSLTWGDIGKKLVEVGAIDEEKYRELFTSPAEGENELDILAGTSTKKISINENTSHFVLNTLWAVGLVQKSKVMDEGPMKTAGYDPANFASTGGWTLGTKDAMEVYSSTELVSLNDFQQNLVKKIADSVFRPCCDNPTSFPDCNHGMAALGLIELEVAAGVSEDQIYKDLLAFNSFWFPQNYLDIAAYLKQEGSSWSKADPKTLLGKDFSSASGSAKVSSSLKNRPQTDGGGSCGV